MLAWASWRAALTDTIVAAARPGDHIVIMSNGAFGGIHDKLLAQLSNAIRNAPFPSREKG